MDADADTTFDVSINALLDRLPSRTGIPLYQSRTTTDSPKVWRGIVGTKMVGLSAPMEEKEIKSLLRKIKSVQPDSWEKWAQVFSRHNQWRTLLKGKKSRREETLLFAFLAAVRGKDVAGLQASRVKERARRAWRKIEEKCGRLEGAWKEEPVEIEDDEVVVKLEEEDAVMVDAYTISSDGDDEEAEEDLSVDRAESGDGRQDKCEDEPERYDDDDDAPSNAASTTNEDYETSDEESRLVPEDNQNKGLKNLPLEEKRRLKKDHIKRKKARQSIRKRAKKRALKQASTLSGEERTNAEREIEKAGLCITIESISPKFFFEMKMRVGSADGGSEGWNGPKSKGYMTNPRDIAAAGSRALLRRIEKLLPTTWTEWEVIFRLFIERSQELGFLYSMDELWLWWLAMLKAPAYVQHALWARDLAQEIDGKRERMRLQAEADAGALGASGGNSSNDDNESEDSDESWDPEMFESQLDECAPMPDHSECIEASTQSTDVGGKTTAAIASTPNTPLLPTTQHRSQSATATDGSSSDDEPAPKRAKYRNRIHTPESRSLSSDESTQNIEATPQPGSSSDSDDTPPLKGRRSQVGISEATAVPEQLFDEMQGKLMQEQSRLAVMIGSLKAERRQLKASIRGLEEGNSEMRKELKECRRRRRSRGKVKAEDVDDEME